MVRKSVAGVAASLLLVACRSVPQVPLESQPKQMKAKGTDLAYVESGDGVPVVFVHGAILDFREWEPQRRAVAEHHRFVAYSMRYHWANAWAGDGNDYSFELHAADLAAFLSGLGAGSVHLVGLSYGGGVAMLMALDHPELVRSLTVVEPLLPSLIADDPEAKPILAERGVFAAALKASVAAGDAAKGEEIIVDNVTGEKGHFAKLPDAVRAEMRSNERTVALLLARKLPALSCARLGTIQAPTLVVVGAQSTPFYRRVSDATARCLPHARLVVLPKGAHTMNFEDPEPFNQALLAFLSDQGG